MTDFQPRPATKAVSGIGGWLILPVIGLVLTPIVQLTTLTTIGETLSVLSYLTSAQSALLIAEIVLNIVLFLIAPIGLLFPLFQKRQSFPSGYIMWTAASAIFVVLDLILTYILFQEILAASGQDFFDRDTLRALGGAAAGVIIWIPYMLSSVRVRNTFVN